MKDSLDKLLETCGLVMQRDIGRIESYSRQKKLTPGYARDLREYVKVLTLILKEEKEKDKRKKDALSNLSDAELAAKAKELLSE